MPLIDTHAHVFSNEADFVTNARYKPSDTASAEDYIQQLDANGFNQGVLIQPSFLGTDNSYMLSAIASYPDRLKGVAVVDRDVTLSTLKGLSEQGVVGIRLNLFGLDCPDLTKPDWQALLTKLTDVNFQIELHALPAYLVRLLPDFKPYPIDVVIDHFGRFDPTLGVNDPDYQALLKLLDPKQHWVKVSGYYRVDQSGVQNAVDAFALLKQIGLQDHLLWGSDWPHTQHETISFDKALDNFKRIVNDDKLVTQILTKNNAALFGF
ncbi:amidohydrolase family protein [Psychrobacter pacificensis]|uniref:amidohydrolase family protein n=1 Tax=Psychrobacter pacificensis TaxID=112002 RepID=UPI003D2ACB20